MPLDTSDIQGNILRGYRAAVARHFALQILSPTEAQKFLESLLPRAGDDLQLTTEGEGSRGRDSFLNLGITYEGLRSLRLPETILRRFPEAFREGPAQRAPRLGDVEESSPARWELGGPANPPVHLILSLYVKGVKGEDPISLTGSTDRLEALTEKLEARLYDHHLRLVRKVDARVLPENKVHFGFRDGISQPRIAGLERGSRHNDGGSASNPGEFLLGCGHPNQFGGDFLGDLPPELARNGSYFALRILEQDVAAFEAYLAEQSSFLGESRDFLAAKMLGRFPDGTPLTNAGGDQGEGEEVHLNRFGYADDPHGLVCPIGSHVRRLNPRDSLVLGKPGTRRIIRRGMPYGPPFDPEKGPDGQPRGLVGLFVCGDLEQQFEFLQAVYINSDLSRAGIRDTRDPLMGVHRGTPDDMFVIPRANGCPIVLRNLPRFVTTRGSVYCFMPSITGLKHLASTGSHAS